MVVVGLVGASGNFGHKILPVLLADDFITGVHVLSRHASKDTTDPKTRHVQVDYSDSASIRKALQGCDALINAMGTNMDHQDNKFKLIDAAVDAGVKVYFPR
jgi:putative NADH-flavin reductase